MKKILTFLTIGLALASCGNLDDLNTNKDHPNTVTPDMLATQVLTDVTWTREYYAHKWLYSDQWLIKTMSNLEHDEDYLYNKVTRADFNSYKFITNASKMVEMASGEPEAEQNAYKGLEHFIRAYVFYNLTMQVGDIPCSEAGKAETDGNFAPKYDTQEEVFQSIIAELDEANSLFANSSDFGGDPLISGGDHDKWQRIVNSFELRVLNMLSSKATAGSVNIKSKFEEVAKRPLMRNEDDGFGRGYSDAKKAEWYPYYWDGNMFYIYPVITEYFISMLKGLEDYRLMYYAEPAVALKDTYAPDSWDGYTGIDPVATYSEVQISAQGDKKSMINKRYYMDKVCEPILLVSYFETEFTLAEAAQRGWSTPSSAKTHYENGIRAAMKFTADHTSEEFRHGITIDDAYVDSYLAGAAAFDPAKGLEQIMTQKFIAGFCQVKFNSWYDFRRTGYPQLPLDPNTNLNDDRNKFPMRWMYPENEFSQNKDNVNEALQRQFGGSDTPTGVMWLLK